MDEEIRILDKTFTDLSLCLSYVTGLYNAGELSGIDAKKFKKFESKISEELDKVLRASKGKPGKLDRAAKRKWLGNRAVAGMRGD